MEERGGRRGEIEILFLPRWTSVERGERGGGGGRGEGGKGEFTRKGNPVLILIHSAGLA